MAVDLPPPLPDDLRPCVVRAAEDYGLSPLLIQSVIYVESSYNPKAISKADALGLMQIHSKTWLEFLDQNYGIKRENLFDPCTNIAVGSWVLRRFYLRHGSWGEALAAYNAGHSNERIKLGQPYAEKVISLWRGLYDSLQGEQHETKQ